MKYCVLMIGQINFLQSFVNDLLDLRNIRDNVFIHNPEPFDPMKIIEQICCMFKFHAEPKKVQIICQSVKYLCLPEENSEEIQSQLLMNKTPTFLLKKGFSLIPRLYGDKRRFKQIITNLIKNSIKFTSNGYVKIKVSYRPTPENILIVHVKDSGKGIAKEDFPKLFNRFGKL